MRCGHRWDAAAREAADQTPYGRSDGYGAKAFLATCWWVWGASAQRLTHLGLIPHSAASRRFVFWMILLLAFSAGLAQFGLVGWRTVTNAPRDETSPAASPEGRGWYHVAQANPAPQYRGSAVPTDVWWNPTQTILTAVSTFVGFLTAAWIILACQGAGLRSALGPRFRDQERLEAALRYGTAWLVLMAPAAAVVAVGPVADISAASGWPFVIPPVAIYGPAVGVVLISLCGHGLTLVRLGATVPVAARTRVVAFLTLGSPLICLFWIAVVAAGIYFGNRLVIPQLQLDW